MNALELGNTLELNGYTYVENMGFKKTKHRWYLNGELICANAKFAVATRRAFAHFEAQQEETAQAADTLHEAGTDYVERHGNEAVIDVTAEIMNWQSDEATAQAANDAAGESEYQEVVEDEPTGYMRPCERCGGSGVLQKSMSSYTMPCSDCQGTGIQEDEPAAPSYESLLEENHALHSEIQALKIQIAELEAEKARLLSACMKAQQKLVGDDEIGAYKTLREVTALNPAPVASEAADVTMPKFKEGDKVRIVKEVQPSKEYAIGEYGTIHKVFPGGRCLLRYSTGFVSHIRFEPITIEHYTEPRPTCPDCNNSGLRSSGGACPCGAMS